MKKAVNWFKNLSKKQRIILILIIIVAVLSTIAMIISFILISKKESPKKPKPIPTKITKKEAPKPEKFYASLSGAQVGSAEEVNKPVIGVMIENSLPARPQSGLNQAEVVFEAVAEGGITRFLALYQQNQPELIGPVRSLRGYYLDWASGFQASVAHVGGSGDALARIRDGNHRDMDQFFNSGSFWRSRDRYAPHNVYTNFTNLSSLNSSKGWSNSNFQGFNYKDEIKTTSVSTTQIQINLSGHYYNTSYAYNPECNCYPRSQAGQSHIDREKGQIQPKNIVALRIDMNRGADGYHNFYSTIGSGSGVIFKDGVAEEIIWEKSSENANLILKNQNGQQIKLNRGQTWIVAVPNSGGSISWQ